MNALFLDHLWQSTLFAIVAGLLTLAFQRNRAAIRYWLWFAASMKFLIPFSLLMGVGAVLFHPILTEPQGVYDIQSVMRPFSAATPTHSVLVSQSWDWIIFAWTVWAFGLVAILAIWLTRWSRLYWVLHRATVLSLDTPMPVRMSAASLEPGLVGIWRPVLVLPQGILETLSSAEIRAVIAHELCHFRRRDNLTAALHMAVEALFWFHPLVWWIGTRLVQERENACDESVVTSGSDPETYAESILKVCKLYVHSPLTCAAGISGADLKKRMETIMENRLSIRLNGIKKVLLVTTAAAALALPVLLGLAATPPAPAQAAASNATFTPEQLAERRAEQARPRQAIPFNAKDFDKYVGYYQLTPTVVFTIHRDGNHFLSRLTAQMDVEFFPESPTKFFAIVVPAQISFNADTSGKISELVLHQNGLEQHAPRIEEAKAKTIEANLTARIKANQPAPGTEAALHLHLQSMEGGKLDLAAMTPTLASIAKAQFPGNVQYIQSLGPIKSTTYKGVAPDGVDIYDVSFANGAMEWFVMPLNAEGKIIAISGRRIP